MLRTDLIIGRGWNRRPYKLVLNKEDVGEGLCALPQSVARFIKRAAGTTTFAKQTYRSHLWGPRVACRLG